MNSNILNPLVLFPLSIAVSCTAKQGMRQTSDEMPGTSSTEATPKDTSTGSGQSEIISKAEAMWKDISELDDEIVAKQNHLSKIKEEIFTALQSVDANDSQTTIDNVIASIAIIRGNYDTAQRIISYMDALYSEAQTAHDKRALKAHIQKYHNDWAHKKVTFQLWDLSFTEIHLGMRSYIKDRYWCQQYHEIQSKLQSIANNLEKSIHKADLQTGINHLENGLKISYFSPALAE